MTRPPQRIRVVVVDDSVVIRRLVKDVLADDPNIEVVMRRNGELIRIVDTKTKQAWELDTQKMRLKPDGSELSIDLTGKESLVIRRHGDVAVTVERQSKQNGPPPIPPPVASGAV